MKYKSGEGTVLSGVMLICAPFAQAANAQAHAAVDINTASVADLTQLGFSHKMADKIVEEAKEDPFDNTVNQSDARMVWSGWAERSDTLGLSIRGRISYSG